MQRRERTRQLIELGGLVQKAGLVELLDDDRSAILGALLALADQAGGEADGARRGDVVELCRKLRCRSGKAEALQRTLQDPVV